MLIERGGISLKSVVVGFISVGRFWMIVNWMIR